MEVKTRFKRYLRSVFGGMLILTVLFLFIACPEPPNDSTESNELMMRVTLENEVEHSGILVELLELDTLVFTDSLGNFNFGKLPDGEWMLHAKYPYYSSEEELITISDSIIQTSIDLQLHQQLQFWVEPAETTISMEQGNEYAFTFSLQAKLVNITDERVTVGGTNGPRYFYAMSPQGFQWPFISNPDSITEYCYGLYEWFGANDATEAPGFYFDPGDTVTYLANPSSGWFLKSCFVPGEYLVFSAPTNQSNFQEYFYSAYFWDQEVDPYPPPWVWEKAKELNRTLLKKLELFRPASVTLIE